MKKFWTLNLIIFLGSLALTAPGRGEDFPVKPISLLTGQEPGTLTDTTLRYLADFSPKLLKQPMIVLNRPGGGGSMMLSETKTAKPDGYTIGIMTAGGVINALLTKVPYHPLKDFDTIIHYMNMPDGLVVSASSPFKTVDDLIQFARANPGKVTYGSAGPNIALNMARLGGEANVKWTNIPYGGSPSIISALLGGHLTCAPITTTFTPFVKAGKLRLLATFTEKRLEVFPNIPTMRELGYDIISGGIYGIIGPKGLPQETVKVLHDFFLKGMETPQFQEILKKFDAVYEYRDSETFKKYVEDYYNSRVELMKKYGEALK